MSSPVIDAIKQALVQDENNTTLRCHLLDLLVKESQWQDALHHAGLILSKQPDHLDALGHAATAARALNQIQQAMGYERLFQLLKGPDKEDPQLTESAPPETPVSHQAPLTETFPPKGPYGKAREAEEKSLTAQDSPATEDRHSQAPEKEEDSSIQGAEPTKLVRFTTVKGGMADDLWEDQDEPVTLADVAGMHEVKKRLELSLLGPMKNPDLMKLYGKSLRGGLLLYGPPGCGKTFMAKAIAGELGARFLSIGLSDVMDMYLGQSERNLHELFESARRKPPSVIFLDEIDALGRKRSLRRESASRDIVNQLLTELDNVKGGNKSLFVLAATNHPWDVDSALRRPGRLDRTLLVLPPDEEARHALLQREFEHRPTETLDLKTLAKKTERFSGADLVHLCESAAEIAIADSVKSNIARPINQKDCKKALKELRPSTRSWFETAKNYALFANDGGAYDELLTYMRERRII